MGQHHFARAFKAAKSNPDFTPEMKAKVPQVSAPPRGLIHSWKGPKRGSFRRSVRWSDHADTRRRVFTQVLHMAGLRWRKQNSLPTHVRYLMRTHRTGLATEAEAFFDGREDRVDGQELGTKYQYDDHQFRIVIAPLDGDRIETSPGGMRQYVRDVMAEMERDLGSKLAWFAVIHRKSDSVHEENRHAHVVVRGVDDQNGALRMTIGYKRGGFPETCQRLATDRLGSMSRQELHAYQHRQELRQELRQQAHKVAEKTAGLSR